MKTIINESINEIEIKNSRFITMLFKYNDNDDINKYLDIAKEKYPKATHYTYAYITESRQKSSDDNEPGGTAGIPMLNVLIKNELINVLAITIRYFGGIKLGAGGLNRAYSKSVNESIKEDNLIELIDGYLIEIEIDYDNSKEFEYKIRNYNIISSEYLEKIKYIIEIPINDIDNFNNYKILSKKLIKKV